MKPVISFVGYHNSGKTTLIVKVVQELKSKGLKLAVVKHSSHGFDLATSKDTEKLFEGGADIVYAASPLNSIIYRRNENEPEADQIIAEIQGQVDLVITEGYKRESYPKIEVMRQEIGPEPMGARNVIARVADFTIEGSLPLFGFEDSALIADFIMDYIKSSKLEAE